MKKFSCEVASGGQETLSWHLEGPSKNITWNNLLVCIMLYLSAICWEKIIPFFNFYKVGPKWSQMIPKYHIWFQMIPHDRKLSQISINDPNEFWFGPKWSCFIPNGPKFIVNGITLLQMVLNGPKQFLIVQYDFKWSQMVPNYYKWS